MVEQNGQKVALKTRAQRPLKSGLEIYKEQQQVAAISFVNPEKIWLQKDISSKEKELLLTASYSLTLLNWLDSNWRW